MQRSFRSAVLSLACLSSATFVGCNADVDKQRQAAADANSSDQTAASKQVTKELEAVKAKLSRDTTGAVIAADLRGCELSDSVITELAQLTTLQQIDLRECALSTDQFKSIVTPLAGLRAVRLSGKGGKTNIEDDGIKALTGCKDLRVLAIDELWCSEDGLKALLGCTQLSELYLAGTLVDDPAMATVAQFKQLKKIRLARTQVSEAGLKSLVGLKLEDLDLSECSQINDAALQVVSQFPTLKRLNLWRVPVSDEGLSKLASLTQLNWYNLDNTLLTDVGLDHLAGMTELTFLHLGSTGVSDAGMPKLLGLKKLKDLKVTRTSVTEEKAKQLSEQLPGLEVQVKYREE